MKCGLCESGTYCEIHDGPVREESYFGMVEAKPNVMRAEVTLRSDGEPPQSDVDILFEALAGGRGDEQALIAKVGIELLGMLLRKNERYGSSATNPIRVFSKSDPLEGIHLRMDDKLSRIRAGAADDDEDPVFDLGGYCILELVARRKTP